MGGGRGNAGYGRRTAALSCLTVVGSAHPPGIIVDGNCSGLIIRPRNEIAILRLLDGKDQSFRAYQRNHGAGDY